MVRARRGAYNGWGVLLTVLAAVVTATLIASAATEPADAAITASDPVALGAYISGAPGDPAKIDEFTSMVGEVPAIVMWYQDWRNSGFRPAKMDAVASQGATPMVTWEPWDWNATGGAEQPEYALSTIVAGDHDAYVRQWARDAAAWGEPFYLRFAHEMNGYWYPWGTQSTNPNGNSPEQYVAAWRRVHDIFVQEGATNARWVWNPDFTHPGRPSYASLYPGDAYVDWVAIDAYNWGTSRSWSSWQTFPERFDDSYKEMDALNDKPMMVGETASAEQGGDKAAWIRQTFLTDIPSYYPQVRAVVWFNEDKGTDWRVNSSPSSLEAYKEVAAWSKGRINACKAVGGTACDPDTTPPTIASTDPANYASNVSRNTSVTATFSEAMRPETLTASTMTLAKYGSTTPISARVSYDEASKKATLKPSSSLGTSTWYVATVKGGAGGAKDLAGNALAADRTWYFYTSSGPTVSSTDPANYASNVSRKTSVTATFSEAMDPGTLTASTMTLAKYGSTTPISATVSYDEAGKKATLDPSSNLEASTWYVATIKGGAGGAKDPTGTALAADRTWYFYTAST